MAHRVRYAMVFPLHLSRARLKQLHLEAHKQVRQGDIHLRPSQTSRISAAPS